MSKVLIYSPNLIGPCMAGGAIRAWEFAHALAQEHEVILFSPAPAKIQTDQFKIICCQDRSFKQAFQQATILITQRLTLPLAWLVRSNQVKVIIDAYNPTPFEILEHFKAEPPSIRKEKLSSAISNLIFSFKMADGILCASERQRALWMGFLLSQKLLSLSHYDQDPTLRHFLEVVPFGLPDCLPPRKVERGLRKKYGFQSTDKILLWGGGIWNWFDPLSLIKAVKIISQKRSDLKLVFMGVTPPDPTLPEMPMSGKAIHLAQELQLLDRSVFFNSEWVPYEERHHLLLDADIGVSTHFDHLETTFSFRTRLLDYLWTSLPLLTTTGDAFAEMIQQHELGKVVPDQDEGALVQAILALIDQPEKIRQIKQNMAQFRERFYWSAVTEPLKRMITRLQHSSQKRGHPLLAYSQFMMTKVKEKGLKRTLQKLSGRSS